MPKRMAASTEVAAAALPLTRAPLTPQSLVCRLQADAEGGGSDGGASAALARRLTAEAESEALARKVAREEEAAIRPEFLSHGVVVLRQMASPWEQEELLKDCISKGTASKRSAATYGGLGSLCVQGTYGNTWADGHFVSREQGSFRGKPCCIELARNVFREFWRQHGGAIERADRAQRDSRLHFPKSFDECDNMVAGTYCRGGTLLSHVDAPQIKGDGWIVLLSVGADIEYGFRARAGAPISTTRVRSGDAACFNGKVVHHEITLVDGNVPEFWPRLVPDGSYDRIGLQMRCNGDDQWGGGGGGSAAGRGHRLGS